MIQPFEGDKHRVKPGTIAVWNGGTGSIPAGWVFCDGGNGTPDLRDRMMKSVPQSNSSPGSSGGQTSYTISKKQMPSHRHGGSTTTDGSHTHGTSTGNQEDDSYGTVWDKATGGGGYNGLTNNGYHSHSLNVNFTGSDNSVGNMPAYQEVTFIMKV